MGSRRRSRGGRSGNELVEFALVATVLLPLLFGTFVVGMNLGRSVQVSQVSRDAGHLYARAVDFSDAANQQLLVRLAQGLPITTTGGQGVIILSTVMHIGDAQCDGAGLSGGACTNRNQDVFTHRIVIGNSAARSSAFGTPTPALIDSHGTVSNYLTDAGACASGFQPVLPLQAGEVASVAEVYFPSPDWTMPGYQSTGVYARTIF
jgi:Flp pilus assembly protein TadG